MRCWNCNQEIPDGVKACQACEALVADGPSPEEMDAVADIFSMMDEKTQGMLMDAIANSTSAEEFANMIMVGECPKCGSDQVGDCDADPEIDNILVGRCFECGQLWCVECGEPLKDGLVDCGHFAVCESCDEVGEEEFCPVPPTECDKVVDWIDKRDSQPK